MSQPPIGIDLGTTFSVIAHLDDRGVPKTILNSEGDLLTPSVVLFEDHGVTVGKEAQRAAILEPHRVADFAKRDIGSPEYHRKINGKNIPPEVIESLVLKRLKTDAEEQIGPIESAVITVPAYFNEPRRKATQDAGRLADLQVLDIINEPTAAAIAYGFLNGFLDEHGQARRTERILVYDLGGGTFDVTLMEIHGSEYRTLATDGDVFLGGMDWDRALVDHVAQEFRSQSGGLDPREDASALQRLLRDCEEAKRSLTAREQTTISFEHRGKSVRLPISRQDFEELTAGLMERTLVTSRSVLKDAGLTWNDLTRVLVVGGSTRMPVVRRLLQAECGGKVDRSVSTDEAVAHGAAIYAGVLMKHMASQQPVAKPKTVGPKKLPGVQAPAVPAPAAPGLSVKNVSAHNLGVLGTEPGTGRPKNSVIIPRNTPLPATQGKRFRTAKDGQRNVLVRIVEGGDSGGRNATHIGKCVIRDLPTGLKAGTPVEVLFTYGTNGRLTVRARLPETGQEATLALERKTGMSDELMKTWKDQFDKRA